MTVHEPGIYHLTLSRDGASDLRYTLAIPDGFSRDSAPLPLVICLHYAGHGEPFFGTGILINLVGPALHELGAIIASPDCPTDTWDSPGGERGVLDLLDDLVKTYPIDPRRVVLTGYSMGGMGVWYIAARHPDRFSVAIPICGKPEDDLDPAAWNVPLYAIHSSDDELIPAGPTGQIIDRLRDRSVRAGLLMAEGITHFEVPRFIPHLRTAVGWIRRVWELNERV